MLNSHRAKRASVRAAGAVVVTAALLATGASAASAAPVPINSSTDIRPSNITFEGVDVEYSQVLDANGAWAGDAYDDFGYFLLDAAGPNERYLTFGTDDCTIDGSESGGTYTSNPTILTCTALDLLLGTDSYDITVTRTFRGSWVRWDFAATGPVPMDVQFEGNLGSDTDTTYYPGVPASNATTWVSGDDAGGDPVLFADVTANDLVHIEVSNGNDDVLVAFTDSGTGDRSFRFDQGLVDYDGDVADPAAAFQCAVDYAVTLSDGSFGGLLNPPGCGFDYSGDEGTPPPSWYQATGRATATATCADGWRPSYDLWPNGGTGGFTCEREEYWDKNLQGWAFRGR